jgi:hypothetical protein
MLSLDDLEEGNSKNLIHDSIDLHQLMCLELETLILSIHSAESFHDRKDWEITLYKLANEMKLSSDLLYEARKEMSTKVEERKYFPSF